MTWVKVCGITDERGLAAAVEGGADAVGFVIAEGSPRSVTIDRAAWLMRDVPILRFVVTVDACPSDALWMLDHTGADGVQNHGSYASEVAAEAADLGYLSLRPVPVGDDEIRAVVASIPEQAMPLFDTASTVLHGGTGLPFDWATLSDPGRPFVLAGGLGPDNIAEAVAALEPFGVDASSRLELTPGIKDPSRVIDFIEKAKQA